MITTNVSPQERLKTIPPSADFGFGQHFSDHWFFSKFSEGRGWHSQQIQPYGNFPIDPGASVLHYGQALFEGMKAFAQPDGSISIFRPEFNYLRMKDGAARLRLEAPPHEIFMNSLRELIQVDARWVPKDENCALYIRPTLIGTEPFLGVRPSRDVLFYVLLSPVGSYYGTQGPVRIWVEEKYLRAAPGGLGAVKAGANYAASLEAAYEAKQKGFSQVLWLDVHHEGIEEVGTMNVFFVFKNEIVTPALNGSILPGGVRDSVLQLLRHQGVNAVERRITITEVMDRLKKGELLEAFGTGTAAVISPIGELSYKNQSHFINDNKMGPVASKLYTEISDIQRGRAKDPFGWMIPIKNLK